MCGGGPRPHTRTQKKRHYPRRLKGVSRCGVAMSRARLLAAGRAAANERQESQERCHWWRCRPPPCMGRPRQGPGKRRRGPPGQGAWVSHEVDQLNLELQDGVRGDDIATGGCTKHTHSQHETQRASNACTSTPATAAWDGSAGSCGRLLCAARSRSWATEGDRWRRWASWRRYMKSISSISKTRVAPPGMTPPAPREPYAAGVDEERTRAGGMARLREDRRNEERGAWSTYTVGQACASARSRNKLPGVRE